MKTKLVMVLAWVCAAMFASAEDTFLYWMVDVGEKTEYNFNYATIKATGADGTTSDYLLLYGSDSAASVGNKLYASNYSEANGWAAGSTTGEGIYAGLGGYGVGSKLLIELWTDGASADAAANRVAYGWFAYGDLLNNIFSAGDLAGASPFTVGASQLVPEPTGGLLTLLGFAMLALRRKQKVA